MGEPRLFRISCLIFLSLLVSGCAHFGSSRAAKVVTGPYRKGEYGYDVAFLEKYAKPVELADGESRLLIAPEYQGRVMTSSSSGTRGFSHGWINYDLIASSEISAYANPYGGEERIWLGPEGGQFSLFFTKRNPGVWTVPAALDHETFQITAKTPRQITMKKDLELLNRSGTKFRARVTRIITLLDSSAIRATLNLNLSRPVRVVAYRSENRLKNTGDFPWTKEGGALAIWMLSMLKASPQVVVIVPCRHNGEAPAVNDYFGGLPENRLKVTDTAVFFRADGESRSKIGIAPSRALPLIASYDGGNKILSVLNYALPDTPTEYVNSLLTDRQEDPFSGDVLNAYNDGPAKDGSRIGKVYEMETSSPAAFLKPGEEVSHVQYMYHFEGNETDLDFLTRLLLHVPIREIESWQFQPSKRK